MTASEPTAAPRRGRDIRRERAQRQAVKYPYIRRKLAPVELLSSEAAEIIEANAETIMEEIGIEFRRDPESLRLWKEAGADVSAQPRFTMLGGEDAMHEAMGERVHRGGFCRPCGTWVCGPEETQR